MFRVVVFSWLLLTLPLRAQTGPSIRDVERQFLDPPADSRIMMRWWWFGPSMTGAELDREMRAMKDGGIGGFEIAAVYPLAVDNATSGLRNYKYLSPEFLQKITFVSKRARELGLRMDVTIGSGWSYGGPYITPRLAASHLRSSRREIAPGVTSLARPEPFEDDRLVAAFIGRGSLQEADADSFRELTVPERGSIPLPPGDGPRVVLFYFAGQTGQVVKRAAVGAEGYVLDHYSRAAIATHLKEAGDALVGAAEPGSINSIFCDSLEVYDADWTEDLLQEFRARRGYDLQPLLPLAELGNSERADAVRRDYGRTLTELFEERFLVAMRDWSRKNGVRFRIQNYGVPPAALSSYRFADVFDGEGFEWRALSTARWAASASHLLGKPVTSSETWTWLHSPTFRATPLDLKAEADLHFLSGVNQLIGHGWPYSAPQAGEPGWMFYAAGAYSDKNPWWPVMPDLAKSLQRVSHVLRQGEPVVDIALYAPTEDAWAQIRPSTSRGLNLWSGIRDLIGPTIIPSILDAGYNFDLVDDRLLQEATQRRYRIVVLPAVKHMPDATRRWLDQFTAGGGKVVSAGEGDLAARLNALVTPDVRLLPATPSIGFVHRRLADAEVYFFANTGNVPREAWFMARGEVANAEIWNPVTGERERPEGNADTLPLTLEPYGSRIVVFRRDRSTLPEPSRRQRIAVDELRTGWTFAPDHVAPRPVDLPYSWADDSASKLFSGKATFRRDLELAAGLRAPGVRLLIDFGPAAATAREALPGGTMRGNSFAALIAAPIREAAIVFVNGQRAGAIWSPPYRIDVTGLLRDGRNEIAIEVYNTAINRLSQPGLLPNVAAVTERYGQRFRLQDLDHVEAIPSGILAVPRLVVER